MRKLNKMKKSIVLIVLNVLLYQSYGQANDSAIKKLTTDLEQIQTQNHLVGFSVAIVNHTGVLFEKGFGYADNKTNKKYTKHTIQNIASISKTFIGVSLLKAQELGKLNLDDPINEYLPFEINNPYFPNVPITIRHLATHTSSIGEPSKYEKNGYVLRSKNNKGAKVNNNFRSPQKMMQHDVFIEKTLSKEGKWYKEKTFLNNKPGERFRYSNVAAGVAALIIENATKESFSNFTHTHILEPLQMANSGWFLKDIDSSKHSKLYRTPEKELAFYQLVNYPDGSFITSSSDLGKYLAELIKGYTGNGSMLTKESYKELYTSQLSDQVHKYRDKESVYDDEYDMGVFMGMSNKGQIGHTGGDPGVRSFMFFNTKTKIGKILIINTDIISEEGYLEYESIWKTLEKYENKL